MPESAGWIWFDKSATDDRVWCVRRNGITVRARAVKFSAGVCSFEPAGHMELQPSGPRGAIYAENIDTFDEGAC